MNERSVLSIVGAVALTLGGVGLALAENLTYHEHNLTHTKSNSAGEPEIAVNPTNPKNIVWVSTYYRYVHAWAPAVAPDKGIPLEYEGIDLADLSGGVTFVNGPFNQDHCFVAVSDDGGNTWTPGNWPQGDRPFCGDPMLHVDASGVFYLANDWMGHPTTPWTPNSWDPVGVAVSTDGGHNWSDPVDTGTQTDRPYMRVDVQPAYAGWVFEESGFFGRTMAYSSDQGKTWSKPVSFAGSQLAVNNHVLATVASGNFLRFDYTTGTFDTGTPTGNSGSYISADPTTPGRFAVGNTSQVVVTSDNGANWTVPVSTGATNVTKPWMDFGWGGYLAVMWRDATNNNVYSVVSTDHGASFSAPLKVNTVPRSWSNCLGDDLSWVASDSNYVYVGWAATHELTNTCNGIFARVPVACYFPKPTHGTTCPPQS
jgi:hypothetical protein